MFPQTGGPQAGNGFTTSAMIQQTNNLLGNPQIQAAGIPSATPVLNSTAPASSTTDPNVATMVKALKGGV